MTPEQMEATILRQANRLTELEQHLQETHADREHIMQQLGEVWHILDRWARGEKPENLSHSCFNILKNQRAPGWD